MKQLNRFILFFFVISLLLMAAPTIAQDVLETNTPQIVESTATLVVSDPIPTDVPDVTPPETPTEPLPGEDEPISTPSDLFEQLVKVLGGTYIGWAAAGVLVLTGLVKMAAQGLFKKTIDGKWAVLVAMIFQVAIWISYSVAVAAGKGDIYKQWYLSVIELARSFLPFAGAIFAAQLGYIGARKINAPVVGYQAPRTAKSIPPATLSDSKPAATSAAAAAPVLGAWEEQYPADSAPHR